MQPTESVRSNERRQGGHVNHTGFVSRSVRRKAMRKWCVFAAVGAISLSLAVPLSAQQKNNGLSEANKASDANAEKAPAAASAAPSFKVVPIKGAFALPAAPRATPFPGPAAASKDTRTPGRLVPKIELASMYQYVNFMPGAPFANFNTHGSTGSFTYNASRWIGLTAEFGGYRFTRDLSPLIGTTQGVSGTLISYLFGPRLNLRKYDHFVPFAEMLVGGVHGGPEVEGTQSQNNFALAPGGGLDIVLTKNLAWRFAELNYFMTDFSGPGVGATGRQNNFRAGTGLVARFGIPNPPAPPANHPPVASCSLN